jgi:hypothetical protein
VILPFPRRAGRCMLPNSEYASHQKLCMDGPSAHAVPFEQKVIEQ